MPRQLKERTHAGKTWTKAKYFQFIRSALRQAFMRYPVKMQVKKENRKAVTGKKHTYEYKCAGCKKWFMDKEVHIDHIEPAGSLNDYDDLPGFVQRLFCEPDNLQVLCKQKCHAAKTAKEKAKK